MTSAKSDPIRRCMPLEEWPARDREAWIKATTSAGPLDDSGLAAHWRDETRRATIAAYGRYLTYLERNGELRDSEGPESRVSKERLHGYFAELATQVASVTLAGRIRGLVEALRVMVPYAKFPYLKRALQRAKARARPIRRKRGRLQPTDELFQLALDLMSQAEQGAGERPWSPASNYRDGLTIALLVFRPVRRRNLATMRIGTHLVKHGDRYRLSFDETETKAHRSYLATLPPALTPYIDRYLSVYRPHLLKSRKNDHVWISWRGLPMTGDCFYGRVVHHTKKRFGRSMTPHLFRDAAVTTLGDTDPEAVWVSMALLHHSDPRMAEKHYDQAKERTAVISYQNQLLDQRRAARSKLIRRRPTEAKEASP